MESVMYHLADGNVLSNVGKNKNQWRKAGQTAGKERNLLI